MKQPRARMKYLRLLIYFLLLALALTAISFRGGFLSYGFLAAVLLVPVASFLYLFMVYLRFRIYQEIGTRSVTADQPVSYYFVLKNDDWFSFSSVRVSFYSNFSEIEKLPDDVEYELLPGEEYRYETRIKCRYRGEYEVGVREVTVADFFRLFRLRYRLPGAIKAIVLPKIPDVSAVSQLLSFSALQIRETEKGDTEPDSSVRDYVPGDSTKRIHWKASAKEQKLRVRRTLGEEKTGAAILFDTERISKDPEVYIPLENKMLETLIGAGYAFSTQDSAFHLYLYDRSLKEYHSSGMRDFEGFYGLSAAVAFQEGRLFDDTLDLLMENGVLFSYRLLILVIHKVTERVLLYTEKIAESGSYVLIYAVTDESGEDFLKESTERRKFIRIGTEEEVSEKL